MRDFKSSFDPNSDLHVAVELLFKNQFSSQKLPNDFPQKGIGEREALELLAPHVLGEATKLYDHLAFAHMDPPTPWITWALSLWNARLNQNLLHPSTAPFAKEAENIVINWLCGYFGMQGGHFCSGSTLANLTAIWAAREVAKVRKVIASSASHISIQKAAHILGLEYESIPIDATGKMDFSYLKDISQACLVLTAGTTTLGAIDSMEFCGKAAWTHVDAAWAGSLRLSPKYTPLLDGIEYADSLALSAHKWLFQPKDSAIVFFKDIQSSNKAISFGSSYLATPNIGIQGSRGASATILLATLLAWGKEGLVDCIEHTMSIAEKIAYEIAQEKRLQSCASGQTGINVFRPLHMDTKTLYENLPHGMFSTCNFEEKLWIRSVCANPLANPEAILKALFEKL